MPLLEKTVLYEKYTLDRMASIYGCAAQVFASQDPKKSGEFLTKYMDALFPEVAKGREHDVASKLAELKSFSDKTIMLVPSHGGYALKIEEGKGKK
jgi:hypothetical protein